MPQSGGNRSYNGESVSSATLGFLVMLVVFGISASIIPLLKFLRQKISQVVGAMCLYTSVYAILKKYRKKFSRDIVLKAP
jgi:positive regulator of sigma E activity